MNSLRSHFVFSRSQRGGIFLLVLSIVSLLLISHFYSFDKPALIDVSSSEVIALQNEIDSLRLIEIETRKPKQYPFNPNYMTDFKAYTLGLSPEEFDRLKHFRSKNNWINSAEDFKRVTEVSDSILDKISPLFKFPAWVTNPKRRSRSYEKRNNNNGFTELTFVQKIDLNLATSDQLREVSGVGEALSTRIIGYREKLGGFSADIQLYGVWGLSDNVVKRILNLCTVKTPKQIERMNINTASASDIATIPGISFDLAKEIWEFVALREGIESVSELEKIDGLSQVKLQLIQLYLSTEQ